MLDLLIIFGLVLLNGLFAMAEISIVSAKRVRLKQAAEKGNGSAEVALRLLESPSRSLSTIQIGVTLIGIFVGAMGEASLVSLLQPEIAKIGFLQNYAYQISLAIVVIGIAFLQLVFGELVPKRIGMQYPEKVAVISARAMAFLSMIMAPMVWILSWTTDGIMKLLRLNPNSGETLTEDDITGMLKEGATAGLFEKTEHDIVARALNLDDKPVTGIMTPRKHVHYIDLQDPLQETLNYIADSAYSRFLVCDGDLDNIVGIIDAGTLFEQQIRGQKVNIRALTKPAHFVPETISAMDLLETLQQQRAEIAVVINEYGELEGVATLRDILKVLVGYNIPVNEDNATDHVKRKDGSWLIEGSMTCDRFRELFGEGLEFPNEDEDFHTIAGFIMQQLGHIPKEAESFEWEGLYFEVMDMDRHRVDRVLLKTAEPVEPSQQPAAAE